MGMVFKEGNLVGIGEPHLVLASLALEFRTRPKPLLFFTVSRHIRGSEKSGLCEVICLKVAWHCSLQGGSGRVSRSPGVLAKTSPGNVANHTSFEPHWCAPKAPHGAPLLDRDFRGA